MIITDALGIHFDTDLKYRRIVSLVPSQTEYIIDLIGDSTYHKVVGRTKFCIHPSSKVKDISVVGGTKQIHLDKVIALNPDIIVLNKEENTKEIASELGSHFPVFTTEINSIPSALDYMFRISQLLNLANRGHQINTQILIAQDFTPSQFKKVIYLIWKDPYMVAGSDTFIDKMLCCAGYHNVLQSQNRYPSVTLEEIEHLNPDYIFLSSEPYPFKEKHIEEFQSLDIPVKIVDGEMFSWYGTRLLKSWDYFKSLAKEIN